jgi:hypothetical protein
MGVQALKERTRSEEKVKLLPEVREVGWLVGWLVGSVQRMEATMTVGQLVQYQMEEEYCDPCMCNN